MNQNKVLFPLAGLILFFATLTFSAQPPLWVATKGEAKVYLLGSIHMGKNSAGAQSLKLDTTIFALFDTVQALALEMNPKKVGLLDLLSMQKMMRNHTELKNVISPPDLQRLQALCTKHKLTCKKVQNLKPWAASQMLALEIYQNLGYNSNQGTESKTLHWAALKMKPVIELEGFEFQRNLFRDLSPTESQTIFKETLSELEQLESENILDTMFYAWEKHDTTSLQKLISGGFKDASLDQFKVKILEDRNQKMAQKIISFLPKHKIILVVVGSAHLLGEKSLNRYLSQAGFKIEFYKYD